MRRRLVQDDLSIVGGWSDGEVVHLVTREGDDVRVVKRAARYSFFLKGADEQDRQHLSRAHEVSGVSVSGIWTRVDCQNSWARRDVVRTIERAGIKTFEADVGPLRRLLSDEPNITISDHLRAVWLDIEVDSRATFKDQRAGKARVLCWALSTADGAVVATGLLEADHDDAERSLLTSLFDALVPFDVVTAWSGTWGDDTYDFAVIRERIVKLGLKWRGGDVPWHRWSWIDALDCFRKYHQQHESGDERTSHKLDDVANSILGEGKDPVDSSKTWEAWAAGQDERARLLRYCQKDTSLAARIEGKTGYIALHMAVCRVCRCLPGNDSLRATEQGDGFLLALGAAHGHRWPTKQRLDGVEPYEGAYVMEPKRLGAIDNVHVADFAGLYPSIIRSWNLSPETPLAVWQYRGFKQHERVAINQDVPRCTVATGMAYRLDHRGMFPLALDTLVAERAFYSKRQEEAPAGSPEHERYKRLSAAYKVVANSFYGIIGSPFARYYDRTVAATVTSMAQWLIRHAMSTASRAGFEPFYGDTDALYVTGDEAGFRAVVDGLNERWSALLAQEFGVQKSYVKLEFEKSFRRLIMVSAKRYAGSLSRFKGLAAKPGTKPSVTGLEYKRGDTVRLARTMQKELIELLLRDELPGPTELREWVVEWRRRVLEDAITVDDIVLSQSVNGLDTYALRWTTATCRNPVGAGSWSKGKRQAKGAACGFEFREPNGDPSTHVTKDSPIVCPNCHAERKQVKQPAHVRIARLLESRGEQIGEGTRIRYCFVKREDGDEDDAAIPIADLESVDRLDRALYWSNRIYPPSQRVLEAVYPREEWKREGKARTTKTEDLPLFSDEVAPAPKKRKLVPEKPAPLFDHVAQQEATTWRIRLNADGVDDERLRLTAVAVKAAIAASPGFSLMELAVWRNGVETVIATPHALRADPAELQRRISLLGDSSVALIGT